MTQGLPKTFPELRWEDDLDPGAAETDSDLESLENDVLHAMKETLGSNLADPDSGGGLEELLNGDASALATWPMRFDAQLANWDRLDGSTTTVTLQSDGSYLILVVCIVDGTVVPLEYALGPGGLSGV